MNLPLKFLLRASVWWCEDPEVAGSESGFECLRGEIRAINQRGMFGENDPAGGESPPTGSS